MRKYFENPRLVFALLLLGSFQIAITFIGFFNKFLHTFKVTYKDVLVPDVDLLHGLLWAVPIALFYKWFVGGWWYRFRLVATRLSIDMVTKNDARKLMIFTDAIYLIPSLFFTIIALIVKDCSPAVNIMTSLTSTICIGACIILALKANVNCIMERYKYINKSTIFLFVTLPGVVLIAPMMFTLFNVIDHLIRAAI